MRKILNVLLLAAMIGSLSFTAGCGSSSGKGGGELNFFNWTEYMPQSILDAFTKEYGIKINYTNFSSNEEMYAKIKSGEAGMYDLIVPSDYMVDKMRTEGMLEKLDISKLTNLQNIDSKYRNVYYDPTGEYSVPYMISNAILCYDKSKITEGIKTFGEIFDPKYKNSIVCIDDQRMVIGMAAIATGESVNEKETAKLEKVKEKLFSLKQNVKVFDSDSPKSSMISGETSIGYLWCAEASLAMKENPNIVPVYPEDGLVLMIDNLSIPKDAKNKENAELFINFFLRPEISKMFSDEFPYVNPNGAAQPLLSDEFKNNPASNPPPTALAKGQLLENLGDAAGLYDDMWTEFKNK